LRGFEDVVALFPEDLGRWRWCWEKGVVVVEGVGVVREWVDGLGLAGGSLDMLLKYGAVVVFMA